MTVDDERSVPIEVTWKINEIADDFEDHWEVNARANIDQYVAQIEEVYQTELLTELIRVDVELRVQEQDEIYLNDYAAFQSIAPERLNRLIAEAESKRDQTVRNESESRLRWAKSTEFTDRIRGYKLLKQIGVGGMGTVWAAEQQEPVKRPVAIKLIRKDLGSKEALARFEAERQALALMDHPNIAKVFDAGTTENGNPYITMELIKGESISRYCDNNKLPVNERLKLFAQVCKAVQHAHQRGIIHRDLKPNNILVTVQDGIPTPKVIDFGLAKALESASRLTDKSLVTQFGNVVGTLKYMSPEQAGADAQADDTRSDIYSLGVILYELLTGSTPLDKKTIAENAYLQLLDIIRKTEPPRPSIRISADEDTLTDVSNLRKITPVRLRQILHGELDWVVMKALETDRTRRYSTAERFGEDIERYLTNEPVFARPHSIAYRAKKFVQKNKLLVTSIAAIISVLVFGLLGTLYGLNKALRENRRAENLNFELQSLLDTQEKNTGTLLSFASDLIRLAEKELSQISGADAARSSLTQETLNTFKELQLNNPDNLDIKLELSYLYRVDANLKRSEFKYAAANQGFLEAIAVAENGLNAAANNITMQNDFRHRLASIYRDYSILADLQGDQEQVQLRLKTAVKYLDEISDGKDKKKVLLESAAIGIQLTKLYEKSNKLNDALTMISSAERNYEKVVKGTSLRTESDYAWLLSLNAKASILSQLGEVEEAEECMDKAIDLLHEFTKNGSNFIYKKLHCQTLVVKCKMLAKSASSQLIIETANVGIEICKKVIDKSKGSPHRQADFYELLTQFRLSKAGEIARRDIGQGKLEIEDAILTYDKNVAKKRSPNRQLQFDLYNLAAMISGFANDPTSQLKYEQLRDDTRKQAINKNPENQVMKKNMNESLPVD